MRDRVRSWASQDQQRFEVPTSHGRQARETTLQISFGSVSILPPWNDPRGSQEPLELWAVRVWEEETPEGEEALEWILLTSLETRTPQQAWERVRWYRCRWVVEDYHQCLKTGCRIEQRQVQTADRLIRLLGLLSPLAVRLLQLRDLARTEPDRPASAVIDPQTLAVLAAHTDLLSRDADSQNVLDRGRTHGGLPESPRRWPAGLENALERLASSASPS